MNKTVKSQILARIYGRGRGWAFSPNDFKKDFKAWEINNSLEDLANEGKIRRICRGLYDYPLYSKILEKFVAADMEQVAKAIARKFAWRIQPTGETALTYLGLSSQIASKYIYFSDGPSKEYIIFNQVLEFKHHTFREASIADTDTMLVVQAIKSIGEKNITSDFLHRLTGRFSGRQWNKIKRNSTGAPVWVYKIISDIAKTGCGND